MKAWPATLTRVPYWAYQDPEVLSGEQSRIFEGPVWNFLCLETEIPKPGDWRSTHLGAMPVVVARDLDGGIRAFENRCAHRGALICIEDSGNVQRAFHCVYHAWRYDLKGNLIGISFKDGVNGKGGMDKSFAMEAHGPRKLRTASVCGLVFGTLSADTPPLEAYLGEEILGRMRRVLKKPVAILGKFTQALPNNWKLYIENVKDTYHASLLHTFFATFRITRLTQGGGCDRHRIGRAPCERHDCAERQWPRYRLLKRGGADQQGRQLPARGPEPAGEHRRVRRPHPAADPVGVPGFRAAADPQLPGGAPGPAEGHRCDRAELDLPRLRGRHAELRRMRLKQSNLVGPAGFVSMEDGAVGGFVQRGTATAADEQSIVEMGGALAESQDTRATESSVRGFWKAWRACMGV
jgi:anthranilate 1,2-dioxygenase large subunit/terephthalate 1,2-dioxygenase oxygenase component alpha subunit